MNIGAYKTKRTCWSAKMTQSFTQGMAPRQINQEDNWPRALPQANFGPSFAWSKILMTESFETFRNSIYTFPRSFLFIIQSQKLFKNRKNGSFQCFTLFLHFQSLHQQFFMNSMACNQFTSSEIHSIQDLVKT